MNKAPTIKDLEENERRCLRCDWRVFRKEGDELECICGQVYYKHEPITRNSKSMAKGNAR